MLGVDIIIPIVVVGLLCDTLTYDAFKVIPKVEGKETVKDIDSTGNGEVTYITIYYTFSGNTIVFSFNVRAWSLLYSIEKNIGDKCA